MTPKRSWPALPNEKDTVMAETQQLTELQRASMVARFVEVQDISMAGFSAELLGPRDILDNAGQWEFTQEKQATSHFHEERKLLGVDLKLSAVLSVREKAKVTPLVRCSVSFVLIYAFNVTGGPPPEERDAFFSAFANINAVFNAWPFFREFVHSTLGRMGLQPISLPVYRIAPPAAPGPTTSPSVPAPSSPPSLPARTKKK